LGEEAEAEQDDGDGPTTRGQKGNLRKLPIVRQARVR
jgi:hypothetical protein